MAISPRFGATPIRTALAMPLRLVLSGPNSRWVVRTADGYYDGLSGTVLTRDESAFMPERDTAGVDGWRRPSRLRPIRRVPTS